MYHKVIVLEIKEKYALVMTKDGGVLRVMRKDGMKVGDRIYILEEDILKEDFVKERFLKEDPLKKDSSKEDSLKEDRTPVILFSDRKKTKNRSKAIWKKMAAAVAACALIITSFALLSQPERSYAMVSVDGEKTVELVLDQKNRVKEADSNRSSLTKEEEKGIKGKKIETIKEHFAEDLSKEETIIVGYAFLEDESEEERAALQRRLEKTFGTDHLLYLEGDKEDVENAEKAGKSLGIYLAEQVARGKDFHKVVNEATEEEVLELLESNSFFMSSPKYNQIIRQKLSDYEDEDAELEKDDADSSEEKKEESAKQKGQQEDEEDFEQSKGQTGEQPDDQTDEQSDDLTNDQPDDSEDYVGDNETDEIE